MKLPEIRVVTRWLVIACIACACNHRDAPRRSQQPIVADAALGAVIDTAPIVDAAPTIGAAVVADAMPNDRPPMPPPTALKIIDVKPDRGGSELTVEGGKDRGIAMTWSAVIVDDDGQPVAHGDVKIRLVNDKTCRVRSELAPEVVLQKYHRVRFTPP